MNYYSKLIIAISLVLLFALISLLIFHEDTPISHSTTTSFVQRVLNLRRGLKKKKKKRAKASKSKAGKEKKSGKDKNKKNLFGNNCNMDMFTGIFHYGEGCGNKSFLVDIICGGEDGNDCTFEETSVSVLICFSS